MCRGLFFSFFIRPQTTKYTNTRDMRKIKTVDFNRRCCEECTDSDVQRSRLPPLLLNTFYAFIFVFNISILIYHYEKTKYT